MGIAPYGGRKRVSGQMRRGTWPPPYNFRLKELCRAGHTGSATNGALCSYISHRQRQRRRRRDDTTFKAPCITLPTVWHAPQRPERYRARKGFQNLGFGSVFCILFAAAGKKYAAGGRTPQLTRPIPPRDRPFGGLVLFLSCWRGCSRNRHPAWRRRRRRGSGHT